MVCRVKMGSADMERAPSFLGGLWRMRREAKAGGAIYDKQISVEM